MLIVSPGGSQTSTVEVDEALREADAFEEQARGAADGLVIGHHRLERIEKQTGYRTCMTRSTTPQGSRRLDKELVVVRFGSSC